MTIHCKRRIFYFHHLKLLNNTLFKRFSLPHSSHDRYCPNPTFYDLTGHVSQNFRLKIFWNQRRSKHSAFTLLFCRGTNPDRKLEAVIGTDFSVFYFKQILEDKYPICANITNYM